MKKLVCFLVGVCLIFPVTAQGVVDSQTRALIDRIDRLERDLTLMQRKIYKSTDDGEKEKKRVSDSFPQGSAEHLYSKITDLEQVVADLTSQVEISKASLSELEDKLKKMNQDINFRLSTLESSSNKGEQDSVSVTNKDDVTIKDVNGENPVNTQKEYDEAYALLKKAQYETAQIALEDFLKKYPTDKLAGNAQYWLGETYYVRGQFEQAAVVFAEGVQKYKSSVKGADSLLKLGMSMARLNKIKEACSAFKNLEKEFPKASESLKARVKSEMEKISCPIN